MTPTVIVIAVILDLFFCMKIKKRVLDLFKYTLIFIISVVLLDMLRSRSFYAPFSSLYSLLNWFYCANSLSFVCAEANNSRNDSRSSNQAVVSSHHRASKIGYDILNQGGNAIDAAVAVGYALSVVDPCCGNIGGGGFMLIHLATGESKFIDFREVAPSLSTEDMYLDSDGKTISKASTDSYLSIGIPGTVKGLNHALSKYGSMTLGQVIDPSIYLAKNGFKISSNDRNIFKQGRNKFINDPESRSIFLDKNGDIYDIGDVFKQEDLATTLKEIRDNGDSAFYDGVITDKLLDASNLNNGIFIKEDFQKYKIKERKPLSCEYRNHRIITAPLPGGGVTVCQILSILEGYKLEQNGYESSQNIHKILSAMLFAFSDRNSKLGDPDFVKDETNLLLSDTYIDKIRKKIDLNKANNPDLVLKKYSHQESHDTTHYSVTDKEGNAVSVTYTINGSFGSGKIASGTGFLLNNEMDDFSTKIDKPNQFGLLQGTKNKIEPGKRPLSSMSPTVLSKDGQVLLVTGSPGGPTIPTTVVQTIINIIDFDMEASAAVNSPKIHYQGFPPVILSEPYAINSRTFLELWGMGYKIFPVPQWGAAQSIYIDPETNEVHSINDSRKPEGFFPDN